MEKGLLFPLTLTFSLIILLALFILDISIGSVNIPIGDLAKTLIGLKPSNPVWADIIWSLRIPKSATAILCGAGLSLSGLLTQTLFRNSLTGPDVLGLSSGASLMVALVVLSGVAISMSWTIAIAASMGCAAVFAIIVLIAQKITNNTLLIIGLMISAFASSIIGTLQYFSNAEELQLYTLWTLGNISSTGKQEILIILAFCTVAAIISFSSLKGLNTSTLGNRYVTSLGLSTRVLRWKILIATSLITGSITAFCGPITFIGIAGPHLIRQLISTNNHKVLIPLVMSGGASLLLLCDILTLLPGKSSVLPINAVTAMFGAPVVIWVLIRSKKEFF